MLLRNILLLSIVMLCFSYVTTTVIALQLGLPTGAVNLVIKGIIAAGFLVVLVAGRDTNSDDYYRLFPLLFFYLLYSIRMLYDILVLDVLFLDTSLFYVTSYFFGLTLLPVLAVGLRLRREDIPRLHTMILIALIIGNVALMAYFLLGGEIAAEDAFSGRAQVDGEGEGTAVLNPITISLTGTMLAAYALGRLAVVQTDNLVTRLVLSTLILLGLSVLLIGGSRSPLLSFTACFLIVLFIMIKGPFSKLPMRVRSSTWLFIAAAVAMVSAFVISQSETIYLFDRVVDMFETRAQGGEEARDIIWALAWQDFVRSPVIGYSYVTSIGAYHPHNTLLEALMATGGFGGAIFFIAHYFGVRGYWRILNGSLGPFGLSIGLVSICFFITALFSGSIGQYPEVWVFFALATTIGNHGDAARRRDRFLLRSSVALPPPPLAQRRTS